MKITRRIYVIANATTSTFIVQAQSLDGIKTAVKDLYPELTDWDHAILTPQLTTRTVGKTADGTVMATYSNVSTNMNII